MENQDNLIILLVLLIMFLVYFFPTMIAHQRDHKQLKSLAILNLLLGWTFIVWSICLAWSFKNYDD